MNHNEEVTKDHVQFVREGVTIRYPVEKVTYFESCGNYVLVHLMDGTKGSLRITLAKVQSTYGNAVALIERRHLVFVRELLCVWRDVEGRYHATCRRCKTLPVGRTRFKEVRALFPRDGVGRRKT